MTFSELCQAFTTYTGAVDQVGNAQLALWFMLAGLSLAGMAALALRRRKRA